MREGERERYESNENVVYVHYVHGYKYDFKQNSNNLERLI